MTPPVSLKPRGFLNSDEKNCATFAAVINFASFGIGWFVILWGGLLQGCLFRNLGHTDFWIIFAIVLLENLTKFLRNFPEQAFYYSRDAVGDHDKDNMEGFRTITAFLCGRCSIILCFDVAQVFCILARVVLASWGVKEWNSEQWICNGCDDLLRRQARVSIEVFYIAVFLKASITIIKYVPLLGHDIFYNAKCTNNGDYKRALLLGESVCRQENICFSYSDGMKESMTNKGMLLPGKLDENTVCCCNFIRWILRMCRCPHVQDNASSGPDPVVDVESQGKS